MWAAVQSALENLTEGETALVVAVLGAAVTVLVAVIGSWFNLAAKRQERRRLLYSEAVRVALAWREMLYRVRRRTEDQTAELVSRFHDIQEDQTYYRAWIGTDSRFMKRSYDRLIEAVKEETRDLIQEAWDESPRTAPGKKLPEDQEPEFESDIDSFVKDARSHLSLWLFPRLAPMWRNRKSRSS